MLEVTKTVTYVLGTFATLVPGPYTPFLKGEYRRKTVEFWFVSIWEFLSFDQEFPSLKKRGQGRFF
jgi:hypothetical protein